MAPSPSPSPFDKEWHVNVEPYAWLPTLNASFLFGASPLLGNKSASVNVGPSGYLSQVNSAAFLALEANRGRLGVISDLIYFNLTSNVATVRLVPNPAGGGNVPVDVSANARLTGFVNEDAVSWNATRDGTPSAIAGLLGIRYYDLSPSTSFTLAVPTQKAQQGSLSRSSHALTPIAGLRGRVGLGAHWFIPYYFDYGTADNVNTWQGFAGIAYGYRSGAVTLGWRQLQYYANRPNYLLQSLGVGGPAIGWTLAI
jgi:hypothetical protein